MGLLFVFRWRRLREHSAHLSRSRFNYHPWSPAFPGTVLDVTAFDFILTMTFGAVLFLLYKQGCCVLWQISSMMSLTVHTASNHVFRICLLLIAYKENHGYQTWDGFELSSLASSIITFPTTSQWGLLSSMPTRNRRSWNGLKRHWVGFTLEKPRTSWLQASIIIKISKIIEDLLCVRHLAKTFANSMSFNLWENLVRFVLFRSLVQGHTDSEKWAGVCI